MGKKSAQHKKKPPPKSGGIVELLGLEPRKTEPESVVLPLHHSSKLVKRGNRCANVIKIHYLGKKVEKKLYFCFLKLDMRQNKTT